VHARADRLLHVVAVARRDRGRTRAARVPRPAGFYETYYGKLNFTFHSAAQGGLAAFCRELNAIGALAGIRRPFRRPSVSSLANLIDKAATGGRLSFDEGVRLYREGDLHELGRAAHARRMQLFPATS